MRRYSITAVALAAIAGPLGCAETYTPRPVPPFAASGGPLTTGYSEAAAAHVAPGAGRAGTPLPPKAVELFRPDTVLAGAPSVTMNLDEVVRLAVLRDPTIRAALADVEAAQAAVLQSSTLQNPTVLATQSLVPFPGRPFTEEKTGGPPQLDVVVGYALDRIVFGKRSAAIARDKLAVDAASAAHADRVRTRVAEAVTAYVDVLRARALDPGHRGLWSREEAPGRDERANRDHGSRREGARPDLPPHHAPRGDARGRRAR